MQEDRRLVRQLRLGDQAALRRIYQKYKDGLLTVAACLLVDLAAAEDVLHDVFISLAAGAGGLRIRSSLKGYLTTCVANRARDQLRKAARRDVSLADCADTVGELADLPTAMINRENAEQLCQALGQLPYEQREVITLHLHGELTFREIAGQQEISINTVQSRYRYGIDKLRSILSVGAKT